MLLKYKISKLYGFKILFSLLFINTVRAYDTDRRYISYEINIVLVFINLKCAAKVLKAPIKKMLFKYTFFMQFKRKVLYLLSTNFYMMNNFSSLSF